MQIAVFGTGRIGQVHARNLARMESVELSHLVDPVDSAARAEIAAATGARIASPDEVFADPQVAGVVIASSTDSHADLLLAALAAGKPVFCEKPISLDFATVQRVVAEAEAAGVPVMMGFQRRYDPNFRAVRNRIADGVPGALEQLVMQSRDPSPPPVAYVRNSGGFVRDSAIHDLDQARYMTGEEMTRVFALGACKVDPEIGAAGDIDTLAITLITQSGRMIQMSNSRRGPMGYDQRLEAHCARESLFIDNGPQTDIRIATSAGEMRAPPHDYFIERFARAYADEMVDFVAMIRDGKAPLATIRDGLEAQRLAEAAIVSIKTGQPVDLSPNWQPGAI